MHDNNLAMAVTDNTSDAILLFQQIRENKLVNKNDSLKTAGSIS